MLSYSIGSAVLLAIWAYIGIVLNLGPGLWWQEALVSGFVTGLIVGNIPLGLMIGGSLTLLSLGLWTYGGATIPDFQTGAIVGTAIGALGGGFAAGFAIALPTALLMTQMDVLGRAVTTVFIHGADHYAEEGNERGLSAMHLLGQLPWGLSRAIPVFLAVWLGAGPINTLVKTAPVWFTHGMTVVGHVLPALGFALLLTMLPLRRFWPFLLVGFVLFAYLKMPIIGIAMLAIAIGFLINMMQTRAERGEANV
ncbi:MAG TPA: PTS sugar transporter subunit IIC [Ktedonobacteraceae bacterium]|jgi:PTS system mannose-specific IIC component|nr:PTS sugar transporter subunit IIC [Ktedonobacteraceae bacterium]